MRLTLDIEAAGGTIAGRLSDAGGTGTDFGGWLGLAEALDRLLRNDAEAPDVTIEREVA
jgi:hypothetical protein